MRRHHLFLLLIAAVAASVLFVWRSTSGAPQPSDKEATASERRPVNNLPLGQIVLFNSGVGYFQREGTVEGEARVDLQFAAGDVNDLLKSLVLQDLGGGKVTAVSYDGQEPMERTLKTFALDLTGNPTFGQLLNQARGEKVELTLQNATALTGTLVGLEAQMEPGPREIHKVNLLTAEGMRSVPLDTVQRVRFLNAVLDGELRRALDVLANARNNQKKNVTVQFSGDGKRTVKVGYVVEAPMWKSSYRLVLDKEGKTTLQGWAIVENTSEEDWKDVRLALVSSRPISFQMDLYPPLFVPRPVVEPERFASLRPEEYQGPLTNQSGNAVNMGGMGMMGMAGIGGFAGAGSQAFNQLGAGGGGPNGGFAGNFQGAGNLGGGGIVGFQGGFQGNFQGAGFNRYQTNNNNIVQGPGVNRLNYDQLQQRRKEREQAREEAKKAGAALAELDPTESVNTAALAETVGDRARYTIDHKVNLARQRSALLPLVNREVTARRVSIFNQKVNGKFPLLGLKIKNGTGQNLMQGPASVYDAGSYAGDARLPDLQVNEERLLSFAVDQAVEIKAESKSDPDRVTQIRIVKGIVEETHRQRAATKYLIQNRSDKERTVLVEHPIDVNWQLAGEEKPAERTREYYRFEWKVAAGKGLMREVVQERTDCQNYSAVTLTNDWPTWLARHAAASAKLREAVEKLIDYKRKVDAAQRETTRLRTQYGEVSQEQTRVRTSLDKVPPNTALHKRYLEKLDKLETDIETLQTKMKEAQEKEKKQQAEYTSYLEGLTVD
jgi:hypothetical protein